jgi:heme A synthase
MNTPWSFRFSILVVIVLLIVLTTGAIVTEQTAGGAALASPMSTFGALLIHRHSAETLGILVLVLAIWVLAVGRHDPTNTLTKKLCWTAAAGVIAEALLGGAGVPLLSGLAFFHAFLAQLVLGTLVSVVVLLWPGWEQEAMPLVDRGWPSLRSLSRITVILFVIQVALGAAFRHNLAGVLWHIFGAFFVILFGVGLLVLLTQTPGGQSLRPAVITLGVMMGIQVTLGMVLISISDQSKHPTLVLYSTLAHILNGSATFAVTMITTMLIRRALRNPKPKPI